MGMPNICRICGTKKNVEWHWVAHSPDQFIPMCTKHHKEEHRRDPELDERFPDWKITTLSIRMGTKTRLQKEGEFGETWEELINRLLDELEDYKKVKDKWRGLLE